MTKRVKPLSIYRDFAAWVLSDLAKRQTATGQKPKRARRQVEYIDGKRQAVLMIGQHISYHGKQPFRGSDFSLRLSLAVWAMEKSGLKNKQACEAVSGYPLVKSRVGNSNRGEKGRIENIRQRVVKFIERDRAYFNGQFQMWFQRFRADVARDAEWYSEAIADSEKSLNQTKKDCGARHPLVGMWHWRIALYFHVQRLYDNASYHYKKALEIMKANPRINKSHNWWWWLLPRVGTIKRNIVACENRKPPVSEKPRIVRWNQ